MPGGAIGFMPKACGSMKPGAKGELLGGDGPSMPYVGDSTGVASAVPPLFPASLSKAASPPAFGSTMSGSVGLLSSFLSVLTGPPTALLLNLFTISLVFLTGMRSSGELSGCPHAGHALLLFSADVSAVLAHSSHTSQPHSGIMMQSRKRSLQTGHLSSSGIAAGSEEEEGFMSSASHTGLSIFFWEYARSSISFTMNRPNWVQGEEKFYFCRDDLFGVSVTNSKSNRAHDRPIKEAIANVT